MTLVERLLPPLYWMAAYQQRWMAALTLLLMVSDVNRKSHSDNHENNRENFVIGHDHHLPLYGRGKSQAPSVSFLPRTRRFYWYYNTAGCVRQTMFCNGGHFPGSGEMTIFDMPFFRTKTPL